VRSMADERGVIRTVLETGEVTLGVKSVLKRMSSAKLIIMSSNCDEKEAIGSAAKKDGVRTYFFNGTSIDLGEACKKPFAISAMAVLKPGNAKLTELK